MSQQWYAIVFTEDRLKGFAPDPDNDWKKGQCYSIGTQVNTSTLPAYFEAVPIDEPTGNQRWNPETRTMEEPPPLKTELAQNLRIMPANEHARAVLAANPLVGVQTTAPPIDAVPGILASIDRAVATLPAGARGALVTLANQDGANAAIIVRHPSGRFDVTAWIGKKWSEPGVEYGAAARITW